MLVRTGDVNKRNAKEYRGKRGADKMGDAVAAFLRPRTDVFGVPVEKFRNAVGR